MVRDTVHRVLRQRSARVGLALICFFLAVAGAAPWLAPPEPACPSIGWYLVPDWVAQHLAKVPPCQPYTITRDSFAFTPLPPDPGAWRTFPPDWHRHPLGTTQSRYDIYYGLVWGTRTALSAGVMIVAITFVIGLVVGATSGNRGGWVDGVIMRLVDFLFAVPWLLALLAILAIFGRGFDRVILAFVIFGWAGYARFIRGMALSIRDRDYVTAARALGAGHLHILRRHVVPNMLYPSLVLACLDIGGIVLALSGLAYLGLGMGESYADWGQLIGMSKDRIIGMGGGSAFDYWYTFFFPAAAILLFVLAWNLLGDAIRNAGDPRRQQ